MSANNCEDVQRRLSAYYDGELSTSQATAVKLHVESCVVCTAELASLESITAAFSQTPVSAKPLDLWRRIEGALASNTTSVTLSRRFASWVRESSYDAGLVSMAASVLLLLGLGLWYSTDQGRVREMGNEGAMAIAHEGEAGMSAEHMVEFAEVMDDYLKTLPTDPEGAQQMLMAKYNGEKVDADGAVKLVGYRPIVSGGLPEGYSLASTSVLKMPCCTCVKTVCKRSDGSTLVLFEHDDEEAAWFGDRPSNMAMCGDKDCCLVDLDSSMAATWKQGSRRVTAVGVRDKTEVATLVNWLDKS